MSSLRRLILLLIKRDNAEVEFVKRVQNLLVNSSRGFSLIIFKYGSSCYLVCWLLCLGVATFSCWCFVVFIVCYFKKFIHSKKKKLRLSMILLDHFSYLFSTSPKKTTKITCVETWIGLVKIKREVLNFCWLWAEYYNMPNFINLSCEHSDAACKILDSKLCLFNIIFTLQL